MAIKRKGVQLTARQQRAQTMREAGWTAKEYERAYDKLRNRARNYERATGLERGTVNVADLLARDVHARAFARKTGMEYKPTYLYNAVAATTSASPGARLSEKTIARIQSSEILRVERQFRGVIENSKYSAAISAAVERARSDGTYNAAYYRELVESYARLLGAEKRTVYVVNENISDRSRKIDYSSR